MIQNFTQGFTFRDSSSLKVVSWKFWWAYFGEIVSRSARTIGCFDGQQVDFQKVLGR